MTLLITLWIPDIQQGTICDGLSNGGEPTTDTDDGHGNYTRSNVNYHGSEATYQCDHGYTMEDGNGNAITEDTITCDAASSNGTWPTERPICVGTMIMFCLMMMSEGC